MGWISFHILIIILLGADLFLHRKSRIPPIKEALIWSGIWIASALLFCLFIYFSQGSQNAIVFLTGYLVEKALSIDNLFVFLVLFSYFQTPTHLLHTVLFWGVIGAILLRGLFIFLGIFLVQSFHWILYLFALFLIFIGLKLAFEKGKQIHPEKNPILRILRKFIPIASDYHDTKFFIRHRNKLFATPLLVVLLAVETTDIIFALDSIPVIFGITQNPFLAYTSNIFAVLGLRALYFVLSNLMTIFSYLHYGLALILVFIGIKMLISYWVIIPILWTLLFVLVIILISILASLFLKKS